MGFGIDWNRFVNINKTEERKITMRNIQVRGEMLQRIVLRRLGLNWDLGAYGGINATRRVKIVEKVVFLDESNQPLDPQPYNEKRLVAYGGAKAMNLFEYGATTRLSYCIQNALNIGVYGSYRLSPVLMKDDPILGSKNNQPSPWNVGIEFEIVR